MVAHWQLRTLSLTCLLGLPVPLTAQGTLPLSAGSRWLRVVRNADLAAYIDRETINGHYSNHLVVWNLWEFTEVQGDRGEEFDSIMFRWQIDCAQRRVKPMEATFYRKRKFVHSEVPLFEDWQSPPPESTGETILIQSCRLAAEEPLDSVP